jgi:hypothetical protein
VKRRSVVFRPPKDAETQTERTEEPPEEPAQEVKVLRRMDSRAAFVEVTNALPVNKDAESLRKRKDFFAKIDRKKKGAVTLADVKWGVDKVLDLRDYLNDDVVKHAYHAASTIGERKAQAEEAKAVKATGRKKEPKKKDSAKQNEEENTLEFKEFRCFLSFLRLYFEISVMFKTIADGDDTITKEEFGLAIPYLQRWNAKDILEIEKDSAHYFTSVNAENGWGETMNFDEFATWALSQELDHDEDDDASDEGAADYLKS